jgi:hypothetical protein
VPNVSGNAALDVLIGLFFLYFLLSIVCSSINEGISAVFKLRGANLERGIRVLLADPAKAKEFYAHWRMRSLIKPPGLIFKSERKPSYIPSRVFALTLLDTFAPPVGGAPDDLIGRATAALGPHAKEGSNETVRGLLQDALTDARGNVDRFRASLEQSFDDVMDRASGWYKRKVQLILLGVALALVVGINADSYALGQKLWKDGALRSAVVAEASKAVTAGNASCVKSATGQGATGEAATCVNEVKVLGLPLGWSHENSPHNVLDGLGKAIGLLVTAFALTLGAPFWFDLLGKVAHLRGSGPPTPGAQNANPPPAAA